MGQGVARDTRILWSALALSFSLSCKVEEQLLPTTPVGSDAVSGPGSVGVNVPGVTPGNSASLTAPIIADPLSGANVSEAQPTLTVLNSARSGSEAPTYLYQVSTDSTFSILTAQSPQVAEGANGRTSWKVDRALGSGRYFWRVRARQGTNESSFSATAEFSVGTAGSSAPPPSPSPPPPPPTSPPTAGTILSDPLTGGSIGDVSGGRFTSGGWEVRSPGDFIRYEVPALERGWVEFDIAGLTPTNGSHDQFMLFGMWDPSAGDYRENRYRVHLQKLHPNPHNPPYLRVRWIANGEQHDSGSNFYAWEQQRTYRFRIEWGPGGGANQARVLLDGALMIEVNYSRAYRPSVHWIELGIGERSESVVGARYSNFRVGQ